MANLIKVSTLYDRMVAHRRETRKGIRKAKGYRNVPRNKTQIYVAYRYLLRHRKPDGTVNVKLLRERLGARNFQRRLHTLRVDHGWQITCLDPARPDLYRVFAPTH